MQMVGGNGGNQFRQSAGQNAGNQMGYNAWQITGNLDGYNALQNVMNQVRQNAVKNPGIQNVKNQNGLIFVLGIDNPNANQNGNGNVIAARDEGNGNGNNGNQVRCYNYRGMGHLARNCTVRPRRKDVAYLQTQLLIAQKEEAWIQLQAKEFDLMAAVGDIDEIEEVNANYILMANLQQASTSGIETDKASVYDSDGSTEVHHYANCYYNDIFNIVEHSRGIVEQHPATVEETRAYFESLYTNLVTEVEKVNTVNRKMKETNGDLTTKLDDTPSVAWKFLKKVTNTIVTLQSVIKQRMNANITIGSSPSYQEFHKIIKDEIASIVNQVNARVQNFKNHFVKEAAKFDIMSIVQSPTVVETSDLQTELERTEEKFENSYNNMQHQIEQLQAQLGDLKGKSIDTQCTSDTLDPVSQKLEDENVSLEFQVSEQKDTTNGTSVNTKFAKQSILRKPPSSSETKLDFVTPFPKTQFIPKVVEKHDFIKPVTSHSAPKPQESNVVKNANVYYVEGLGHNLFSVRQYCDSDLEVAFRRNTCFVKNLEGVDLLKGNRTTNLYTINLHEMASESHICLMACATSTKSWLWHQCLSHLNFDTINDLAKNDLVTGLPKFKYHKEHLCPSYEQGKSKKAPHPPKPVLNSKQRLHLLHIDLCGPIRVKSINGKQYVLVIVDDYSRNTWVRFLSSKDETPKNQMLKEYFDDVGISYQTSSVKTPQQNGVVELRNWTLVEAARTMLFFSSMYDDYIGGQQSASPRPAPATPAPQVLQTLTASTTIADTALTPTNSSSQAANIPNTS
ncbi:retrovirus-related pol polyprotein from transposon TNT 1-94 [Tanacetum coccineum]